MNNLDNKQLRNLRLIFGILFVGSLIFAFLASWVWSLVGIFGVAFVLTFFVVIVEPGFSGYVHTLGKVWKWAFKPGPHFWIPGISSIKLFETRKVQRTYKLENLNTNDPWVMTITFWVQYKLNADKVTLFANELSDGIDTFFKNYLDSSCRQPAMRHSHDEIKGDQRLREDLFQEMEDNFKVSVETYLTTGRAADLFDSLEFKLADPEYDGRWIEIQSKKETAAKNAEIAEDQKKADITAAEGLKQVTILEAEGQSKRIEILLKSFNGDVKALKEWLVAQEMQNLQGTLVQGGATASVMVPPHGGSGS